MSLYIYISSFMPIFGRIWKWHLEIQSDTGRHKTTEKGGDLYCHANAGYSIGNDTCLEEILMDISFLWAQ